MLRAVAINALETSNQLAWYSEHMLHPSGSLSVAYDAANTSLPCRNNRGTYRARIADVSRTLMCRYWRLSRRDSSGIPDASLWARRSFLGGVGEVRESDM